MILSCALMLLRFHRSASATAVLGIADSCGRITLHEWRDNQVKNLLRRIANAFIKYLADACFGKYLLRVFGRSVFVLGLVKSSIFHHVRSSVKADCTY